MNNITVLLVEDDDFIREIYLTTLEQAGIKTVEAWNGKEALKIIKDDVKKFDVLVIDIVMPEMDGFETLAAIEKLGKRFPTIVCTNLDNHEDKSEAMSLGADSYFCKSTNAPQDLVQEILKVSQKINSTKVI